MTREESDAAIDRYHLHSTATASALRRRTPLTGGFAGIIGPQTMRDVVPNLPQPAVEIGWRLPPRPWPRPRHRRRPAIVDLAFATAPPPRSRRRHRPRQHRLRHVMEKLGMTHRPELDFDHPRMPPATSTNDTLYSLELTRTMRLTQPRRSSRSRCAIAARLQLHTPRPNPRRRSRHHALPAPPHRPPTPLQALPPNPRRLLHPRHHSPPPPTTRSTALIYQLRDAAHTRTFDKLNIPQKAVDARDPMVWFHIYRGPKCAAEKYADGKLPCGDQLQRLRRLHLRRRPQPPVGRRRPPPRRRPPNRTLEPQRPLHPVISRLHYPLPLSSTKH